MLSELLQSMVQGGTWVAKQIQRIQTKAPKSSVSFQMALPELPTTQTEQKPVTIQPQNFPKNQSVWFDRGVDLDEIERKSDYRGRRKIASLDLE